MKIQQTLGNEIKTIKRINLSQIEGLSKETDKFLREDADGNRDFLTTWCRDDGSPMEFVFFCTGDLADLIEGSEDYDEELVTAPEILKELKKLLKCLQDADIDEIEL